MEEMETPTEQAQEDMHHHALHTSEKWVSWAALSSALLAALAAISVLLAGRHANEAMLEQAKGNNDYAWYQAKSTRATVLKSKIGLQRWAVTRTLNEEEKKEFDKQQAEDHDKLKDYGKDQDELREKAKEEVESSERHMKRHETFGYGVTMFQVAIAVAAISVLSKRRPFWYVGLGFGGVGIVFLIMGLMMKS